MDGMGWDGSPGGPRYRAPTVLITILNRGSSHPAKGIHMYVSIFTLKVNILYTH